MPETKKPVSISKKFVLVILTFVIPLWFVLWMTFTMTDPNWDFTKWYSGITLLALCAYLGINLGQKVWFEKGNGNSNDVK